MQSQIENKKQEANCSPAKSQDIIQSYFLSDFPDFFPKMFKLFKAGCGIPEFLAMEDHSSIGMVRSKCQPLSTHYFRHSKKNIEIVIFNLLESLILRWIIINEGSVTKKMLITKIAFEVENYGIKCWHPLLNNDFVGVVARYNFPIVKTEQKMLFLVLWCVL